MGYLTYDDVDIVFEDRVLLHLQIVIVQKLRRGESLLVSWRDSDSVGDGRSSIWLNPAIPLYFKFAGSRVPSVNREWVARLTESADSSSGLVVTAEPNAGPTAAVQRSRSGHPPGQSSSAHRTVVDVAEARPEEGAEPRPDARPAAPSRRRPEPRADERRVG